MKTLLCLWLIIGIALVTMGASVSVTELNVGILNVGATTPCTAPSVSVPPESVTVETNSDVSFTLTAAGTAPLAYQWRTNDVDVVNSDDYAGATTATLWASNVVIAQSNWSFTCVVTNACGSITSAAAVLTVTNGVPPPCETVASNTGERNDYWSDQTVNSQIVTNSGLVICRVAVLGLSTIAGSSNLVCIDFRSENNGGGELYGSSASNYVSSLTYTWVTNEVASVVVPTNCYVTWRVVTGSTGLCRWGSTSADGYGGNSCFLYYGATSATPQDFNFVLWAEQ